MSPLQQIASITANLPGAGAGLPGFGPGRGAAGMGGPGGQQKPFKSILPPIHQAQLDRYDSINTEEGVRQVKKDPEKNRNYRTAEHSMSYNVFSLNLSGQGHAF